MPGGIPSGGLGSLPLMRRFQLLSRSVVLVAGLLTGCGASGGGSSLVQAFTDDMLSKGSGGVVPTEGEARCAAERLVDEIGEERIREAGITEDNAGEIFDVADEQLQADLAAASVASFECFGVETFANLLNNGEASDATVACLDEIGIEAIRDAFAGMQGAEPSAAMSVPLDTDVVTQMTDCLNV